LVAAAFFLSLATFPKGNRSAEVQRRRKGICNLLVPKQLRERGNECFVFEAVKRNSYLLRFTSGTNAESIDFLGGGLINAVQSEAYSLGAECCDSP
jgi:hypothetical protein